MEGKDLLHDILHRTILIIQTITPFFERQHYLFAELCQFRWFDRVCSIQYCLPLLVIGNVVGSWHSMKSTLIEISPILVSHIVRRVNYLACAYIAIQIYAQRVLYLLMTTTKLFPKHAIVIQCFHKLIIGRIPSCLEVLLVAQQRKCIVLYGIRHPLSNSNISLGFTFWNI